MVDINFTFVLFTASFIIFMIAMKLAFFDPVGSVVKGREAEIEENLQASKESMEKVSGPGSDLDKATEILTKARQESQKIISDAVNKANNERNAQVEKALEDINSKLNENVQALQREEKDLLANLDNQVEEIAELAVKKIYTELESTVARA